MLRKIRNLTLLGLVSLLVMGAAAFGLLLPYGRAYGLVHPARVPVDRTPADLGLPYEDLQLTTFDGLKLAAWYVPPQNGAVALCVHGLGGNRAQLLDEAAFLYAEGYGALLLDLRNHGESEGEKTTLGLYEVRDIAAAVDYVLQREGPEAAIATLSHSMGSATALLAAAEIPEIQAVIAISPFTSIEDNISEGVRSLTGLDPRFFSALVLFFGQREAGIDIAQVRPLDVIASISPRAVLLIHGAEDPVLPARNSYELYAAAREPKEIVVYEGIGHGGFLAQEPERYPQKILDFLAQYLRP